MTQQPIKERIDNCLAHLQYLNRRQDLYWREIPEQENELDALIEEAIGLAKKEQTETLMHMLFVTAAEDDSGSEEFASGIGFAGQLLREQAEKLAINLPDPEPVVPTIEKERA